MLETLCDLHPIQLPGAVIKSVCHNIPFKIVSVYDRYSKFCSQMADRIISFHPDKPVCINIAIPYVSQGSLEEQNQWS